MRRSRFMLAAAAALANFAFVPAADAAPVFQAQKVATLNKPLAFAVRPGETNTVYIAQKTGAVRRLRIAANGTVNVDATVVLNVGDRIATTNERGLSGITFNPAGTKFYAAYAKKDGTQRLSEFPYANGRANKSKERKLLEIPHSSTHHYAGTIAFGPDKHLYMTTGDGAVNDGANAQNLGVLLGKMLRINPKPANGKPYSIPPGNPFVGVSGARPEIWHFGPRNPWKWSFDRANGSQWIADVGQSAREEVDTVGAGVGGANFGWNKREGSLPYRGGVKPPGAIDPFYEYDHSLGDCSITGGFVYRGSAVPSLVGSYVFSDFCRGVIRAVDSSATLSELGPTISQPVSFGQDHNGELWVLSIAGGVYRLLPAP